jgi:hypothetical protein
MNSPNRQGSGYGRLLLVILAVLLVTLAVTKPNEAAHRAAVAQRTPVVRAIFGMTEFLGTADLHYHDYLLFSTLTVRAASGGELPLTLGFLGKVHYGKEH